jgi:hypothetical protein
MKYTPDAIKLIEKAPDTYKWQQKAIAISYSFTAIALLSLATLTFSGTHSQLQPLLINGTILSRMSLSFSICLSGLAALAVALLSKTFAISHHSIHSVRGMMKFLAQTVHLLPPDSFFSAALTKRT